MPPLQGRGAVRITRNFAPWLAPVSPARHRASRTEERDRIVPLATLIAAALAIGSPAPAKSEIIPAEAPVIAKILTEMGYKGLASTNDDGTPSVESASSGAKFYIDMLNCDDAHKNCTTVQIYAGFTTTKKLTLDQVNDWNSKHRFATLYLDKDQDPWVEMDVNFEAGVPRATFEDSLGIWFSLLDDVQKLANP